MGERSGRDAPTDEALARRAARTAHGCRRCSSGRDRVTREPGLDPGGEEALPRGVFVITSQGSRHYGAC